MTAPRLASPTSRKTQIAGHGPDEFDRWLAFATVLLLAAILLAIARGYERWHEATMVVWIHLLLVVAALALTLVQLLSRKGTPRHRMLGRVWVAAMFSTALASLFIVEGEAWRFSPIHILSAVVLVEAPVVAWTGRTGRMAHHRSVVRALVLGALVLAGAFTFPFDRLLGTWLFGAS